MHHVKGIRVFLVVDHVVHESTKNIEALLDDLEQWLSVFVHLEFKS